MTEERKRYIKILLRGIIDRDIISARIANFLQYSLSYDIYKTLKGSDDAEVLTIIEKMLVSILYGVSKAESLEILNAIVESDLTIDGLEQSLICYNAIDANISIVFNGKSPKKAAKRILRKLNDMFIEEEEVTEKSEMKWYRIHSYDYLKQLSKVTVNSKERLVYDGEIITFSKYMSENAGAIFRWDFSKGSYQHKSRYSYAKWMCQEVVACEASISFKKFLEDNCIDIEDFKDRCKIQNQRWPDKTFYYDSLEDLKKVKSSKWILFAFDFENTSGVYDWHKLSNKWRKLIKNKKAVFDI